MNDKMKIAFLIIIFLFVSLSPAQDYKSYRTQLNAIDSLTFSTNFAEAENLLNILRANPNECERNPNINKIAPRLEEYFSTLLKNLKNIDPGNTGYNKKLTTYFRQFEHYYSDNTSGEYARQAFEQFLLSADSAKSADALKYYQIAHFSRKIFLEKSLLLAMETFARTKELYKSNRIDEAMNTVQVYNYVVEPNLYLAPLQDSLLTIKKNLEEIQHNQAREEHFWKRETYPRRKFAVVFGLNRFRQNSVEERWLDYYGNGETDYVLVQKVSGTYRTGYSFNLEYLIKPAWALGAGVNTTEFTFTSKSDRQLIFFDYDINCLAYKAYLKYLLRPYIGLQPFVELGAGSVNYKREESTLTVAEFLDDSLAIFVSHRYKIRDKNRTNYQLLFDLGLQYVRDFDTCFSLGFILSFYQNLKDFDFVNSFNYYLTAYLMTSF